MRNIRLDISYDGTRYQGWQRLGNSDNTIQGKLETALSRILDESIQITGSGRTDAGAHARGQVANFHCESTMSCGEILLRLRRHLPEDIGIDFCQEVHERFHARLNATNKTYSYRIWNSEQPCVFDRRYVYVMPQALDLCAMRAGAQYLTGKHDFSAFCTNSGKKKSTVRTVTAIEITRIGNEIRFEVSGDGFLYNMVRIMVGTLIEVGAGQRDAETISSLFGAKRSSAGYLPPARGLCLEEVRY